MERLSYGSVVLVYVTVVVDVRYLALICDTGDHFLWNSRDVTPISGCFFRNMVCVPGIATELPGVYPFRLCTVPRL